MTVVEFGIRKSRSGNNLIDLHVELRDRIRRLFALAETEGLGDLMVYSGARTYAHQKRLYQAFIARGRTHPLVANPDRGFGSKHQTRPSSRYRHGNLPNRRTAAFAADFQWTSFKRPTAEDQQRLKDLAGRVGLEATVRSEWWHFEPTKDHTVWSVAGYGWKGKDIEEIQAQLKKTDEPGIVVDGDYGRKTMDAVTKFQRRHGLTQTGDWTVTERDAAGQDARKTVQKPLTATPKPLNPTDDQSLRAILARSQAISRHLDKAITTSDADESIGAIENARVRANEISRIAHRELED